MTAGGGREPIVQERVLPAPREDVFAAWSDAEGMRAWMCPVGVERASVELDFRVGGRFRIVMHGTEGRYSHRGEYLEIEPPKRIVFTWVSEWLPEPERRTRVTVTLEPEGARRTRLRLVHDLLPEGDAYAGHGEGWARILAKLEAHLAPGGGSP